MAISHVEVRVRTFRRGKRLALALAACGWFRLARLVPIGHYTMERHREFLFLSPEIVRDARAAVAHRPV